MLSTAARGGHRQPGASGNGGGSTSYSSSATRQPTQPPQHKPVIVDASSRLVYANPRDLPSFPIAGLKDDDAAANIAASIGWASSKNKRNQTSQHPNQQAQVQPHHGKRQQQQGHSSGSAASAAVASKHNRTVSAPVAGSSASLKAATTAASAASAAIAAGQSPSPRPASSHQMSSTTQFSHLPMSVVVEPPPSSSAADVGSTAGSSQAAAAKAIGSTAANSGRWRPSSADSAVTSHNTSYTTAARPVSSTWGSSAANQAFRNSQAAATSANNVRSNNSTTAAPAEAYHTAPTAAVSTEHPGGKQASSLRAAKGAMIAAAAATAAGSSDTASHQRSRASTNPSVGPRHRKSHSSSYPESSTNAVSASTMRTNTANALSAATMAHGQTAGGSFGDRSAYNADVGSVPYTTMNWQMFTSHPPVPPEVQEQQHADGLHASAVAMAKTMYNPKTGGVIGSGTGANGATPYANTLQEAAYKLAQERLERLHNEHQRDREYRDHYVDPNSGPGGEPEQLIAPRTRLSLVSRLRRRRSSSDSAVVEDRRRSLEVRNQMSLLQTRISEVDREKQRKDRQNVLAVAQRNVQAQLHDIDVQVYANTGKMHPSLMASWEHKAHVAAQGRSLARSSAPVANRIDLGGGKFMDQAEVDKIAARRVQPLLDDIEEKAKVERERQAALLEEQEERKREAETLKARDREMNETYHRLKQEEKEKQKARKEEEKALKRQEKQERKYKNKENFVSIDDNDNTVGKGKAPMGSVPTTDDAQLTAVTAAEPLGSLQNQQTAQDIDATEASGQPQSPRPVDETSTSPVTTTTPPSRGRGENRRSSRLSMLFARTSRLQTQRPNPAVEANPTSASTATTAASPVVLASASPSVPNASGITSASSPTQPLTEKKTFSPLSPRSQFSDTSSGTAPNSRVKSWFKARFSRPRSQSAVSATSPSAGTGANTSASVGPVGAASGDGTEAPPTPERSFIGGHALASAGTAGGSGGIGSGSGGFDNSHGIPSTGPLLTISGLTGPLLTVPGLTTPSVQNDALGGGGGSSTSLANRSTSMHDVAMAGRQTTDSNSVAGSPTGVAAADVVHDSETLEKGAGSDTVPGIQDAQAGQTEPETTPRDTQEESAPAAGVSGVGNGEAESSFANDAASSTYSSSNITNNLAGVNRHAVGDTTANTTANKDFSVAGFTSVPLPLAAAERNEQGMREPSEAADTSSDRASDSGNNGPAAALAALTGVTGPAAMSSIKSGGDTPGLTPPRNLRDPAAKKSASPIRDSRFLENMEEGV